LKLERASHTCGQDEGFVRVRWKREGGQADGQEYGGRDPTV